MIDDADKGKITTARSLVRKQRIAVADRQITSQGASGQAGIYAVLYQDQDGALTFDVRYFIWSQPKPKKSLEQFPDFKPRGRHRSTTNGVIFVGIDEAYAGAQALVDLIAIAKQRQLDKPVQLDVKTKDAGE